MPPSDEFVCLFGGLHAQFTVPNLDVAHLVMLARDVLSKVICE
jgi:hypothetical protein